jgi:hypothetical protein
MRVLLSAFALLTSLFVVTSAQQPATGVSPAINAVLRNIRAADAGQLAVSEEDGHFLRVMVATRNAKSILEIGAASGYSGIWLGLGARETGGHVVAIEYDPKRAAEASANIAKTGLNDVVKVVHGDAFAEIPKLSGTFDLVFLDAWKPDYKEVLRSRLSPPRTRRRVHGAQRGEQEDRDGTVPRQHPFPPQPAHHDRVAGKRRYVGVVQASIGLEHGVVAAARTHHRRSA